MRGKCSSMGAHCSPARLAVALSLLAGIVLVGMTFDADKIEALLVWVQENKEQGSLLFLALYIAGVVLMLPAMVMAMASGAIFGIVGGALLSWIGSSTGQIIAFVIGRYLLRGIVLNYLSAQFPKWTAVDRAMITEGWKLVTLLRLSPIAPWNILNYALSVTSVPLMSYSIASSLAILPYLLLFVYFGSMARSLADIFTGTAGLDTGTTIIMGAVSCLAMVALVWYTTRISRQAVNNALLQHAEALPPELTADDEVVELLGGAEPSHEQQPVEIAMTSMQQPGSAGSIGDVELGSSGTPRGRQRSSHMLLGGAGEVDDGGGSGGVARKSNLVTRKSDLQQQMSQLHSRSGHASPRSSSPRSARWSQRNTTFS